jgi:TetR/AcrR family transcriptional regulator, repressor of fatR-cypB operon
MEKRDRVLRATLELIPRLGLHNTPVSAIAERAGVAKGTPYLYFESKEALINTLYLELICELDAALVGGARDAATPRESVWGFWSRYARWYLDNPDAANFIQQCEASGILSEETMAERLRRDMEGTEQYALAVKQWILREMPAPAFHALFFGPVVDLAQLQAKREIQVDDELLRTTFEGVCRSVLTDSGPDRTTTT